MSASPDSGSKPSLRHVKIPLVTTVEGPDGNQRSEGEYGTADQAVSKTPVEKRPLLVTERWTVGGKLIEKRIEVRSHLRDVLRGVFQGYLGLNLDADPLVFDSPFRPLVYRSNQVQQYASRDDIPSEEFKALEQLLLFMDLDLKHDIETFRSCRKQSMHTFNELWTAFVPGEKVMQRYDDCFECYEVLGGSLRSSLGAAGTRSYVLQVRQWNCNHIAKRFGYVDKDIKVEWFTGSRAGKDLPVIPLASLPKEEVEKAMHDCIEQGHEWFRLQQGFHHRFYDAPTCGREYLKGRIMVDETSFTEEHRGAGRVVNYAGCISWDEMLEQGSLSDQQALLCPASVGGSSLEEEKWYSFFIRKLRDVEWTENMWDELQLEGGRKERVKSLVMGHDPSEPGSDQKGLGLVLLLHGPPGTGKTLMTESLADTLKRPLCKCSPSQWKDASVLLDLSSPEMRLQKIFRLAFRWNAILLMDEADSFIGQADQKSSNLQGFLRQVEHYRGVLFMTSNMEHQIDTAVTSRLSACLRFKTPNRQRALRAWKMLLQERSFQEGDAQALAEYLSSKYRLDFRVIKSTMRLAGSFARARGTSISQDTIEEVLELKEQMPEQTEASES